ncbi:MAG: DUF805 domain-containing protein [Deltaproteobacteria bacterium]
MPQEERPRDMNFVRWGLEPLRKCCDFRGRARRKEYWSFVLIFFLLMAGLTMIGLLNGEEEALALLLGIAWMAMLLPSTAVIVRRLHDINLRGWWILLGLIPYLGSLGIIIVACIDGTPKENRFGPSPKPVAAGIGPS